MVQWKQLLESLEQNPSRGDLVSGVVCLCRTMQNPVEQANVLTRCAALILQAQPLVALHLLRLALVLSPRDARALRFAKEVFKRRGRWAAEQSVGELLATLSQATAVSPSPTLSSSENTMTKASAGAENTDGLVDSKTLIKFANDDMFEPAALTTSSTQPRVSVNAPAISDAVEGSQLQLATEVFSFELEHSSSEHSSSEQAEPPEQVALTDSHVEKNMFLLFLERASLDPDWGKYSVGFSESNAGLVAFANLLFTMGLIDELKRINATIVLFRIIKENDDHSGAEELFDRLFMQRSPGRES